MLRWRRRALVPLLPFALGASVLGLAGEALPDALLLPLGLVSAALAATLGLFALPVIGHLFAYALRIGGPRYAWSQSLLAALLVPVFYLGVVALPPLVVSDHGARLPRWRRATALAPELEFLRFGAFLGALVGAGLLTLLPGRAGLLLAALWLVGVVLASTALVRRLRD